MVKIERFEDIIYFDNFIIDKELNNHSICKFTALIPENSLNHYFSNLNKKIKIYLNNEKIFYGIVKSIESSKNNYGTKIEVEIISTSILEDIEKKERVFQNPEKTIQDIFDCLNMKELKVSIEDSDLKKEKINIPIFQMGESNFNFIKKLSNTLGKDVIVDDRSDLNILIKIGFSQMGKYDLSNEEYSVSSIRKTMDSEEIKVVLEKDLFLGDILILNNEEYIIEKIILSYEKSRFINTYYGKKRNNCENKKNFTLGNNIYEGEVIDNKDPEYRGRIKIQLNLPIENCNPGDGYWYEYLSSYSGKDVGIVFLPEIGDKVFIKEISGKLYGCNSGRKSENENYFKDPNVKIIRNMFNKNLIFRENLVEISHGNIEEENEGNFIRLTNDSLEIKVKDKKIIINEERIIFENGKSKFQMGDKIIFLCDRSGMEISEKNIKLETEQFNIKGSQGNIEGERVLNLKGNKINLN